MNGYGSKWKIRYTLPTIQMMTMTVWIAMNFQLPMKPVAASAMRAPIGGGVVELRVDRMAVDGSRAATHQQHATFSSRRGPWRHRTHRTGSRPREPR